MALPKPRDSLRPDYHLDSFNSLHIFKSQTPTCWELSDDIYKHYWKSLEILNTYLCWIIEAKHHEKSSAFFFYTILTINHCIFIQREFSQEYTCFSFFLELSVIHRPVYLPKRKGLQAKLSAVLSSSSESWRMTIPLIEAISKCLEKWSC